MDHIKVRLETIQYGDVTIDVAVAISDTEKFYITFAAIESLLNYRPNSSREKIDSKSLKSFLGKGKQLVKKSGFVVNKGEGYPIASLLKFEDLVKLVTWEACINQNPRATALLVAGFADSFRSLAYDQMGIRMEVQDRIERVKKYLGKYHALFDWVRDTHTDLYGKKPQWDYYRDINVAINQSLFGINDFKSDRVDNATPDQLEEIEDVQKFILRQAKKKPNLDPLKLVKFSLELFN